MMKGIIDMKIIKVPNELVLKDGIILDPLNRKEIKGHLVLKNGKIKSVGLQTIPKGAEIIDCSGLVITHGFCDLHVHFREPGREDKETLQTGSMAALAGGFTRVCVMPNTDPPMDSPEAIRFIREKANETAVHIHPVGAITKGQAGKELVEMGAMIHEGAVAFSDDGLPVTNGTVMRKALEYSTMFSIPVINHAEDQDLRSDGIMNEGPVSTELGLSGILGLSESIMIYRDLELSKLTGAQLHVPHVSTAQSAALIRSAKNTFFGITAEVTPHHLYFNDEQLKSFNTNLKVAPPIRGETDRLKLIEAVLDGTIDCIATDHAPHTIEEKEATFDLAPFGMIGLESCFGVVNKVLVAEHELPFMKLIRKLTVNPRRVMGFNFDLFSKGTLAELVIFDRNQDWRFEVGNIYSRSKNTPFVGERLHGKVRYTITRGNIALIS